MDECRLEVFRIRIWLPEGIVAAAALPHDRNASDAPSTTRLDAVTNLTARARRLLSRVNYRTERGMAEHAICDSMKTAGSFDDIVAVPAPSSIAIDEA